MLLYIHIPFCDSKCHYCAFNSYVDKLDLKEEYMNALKEQLIFECENFSLAKASIESVFIGGGTPSTVAPELYKEIFEMLRPYFQKDIEITTEANPNSATLSWLEGMRALGVNRISFGVQSFNDAKLKLLHRAHSSRQAKKALLDAKEAGFENISLDLIYAVAGDTKELLTDDLRTAFSLPINHLSAYALMIEERTPFEKKPHMAQEKLSLTKRFFQEIERFGFMQYEISNFGKYKSKHNLGYWQYKDYIGAGSGAVGKRGAQRYYPTQDIQKYIQDPLARKVEDLSPEEIITERIFLGLRSIVGIPEELLDAKRIRQANILADTKKLLFKNGTFFNTDYLLADEIALFIS